MKISIYQINRDRDNNNLMFLPYGSLEKFQGSSEVDSSIYDKVYHTEVDCKNLETVFRIFNIARPSDFKGHSLSVSDIVEVIESENIEPGFYFCDFIGFKNVKFEPQKIKERV